MPKTAKRKPLCRHFLKNRRTELDMTQQELSTATGIPLRTIGRIEAGEALPTAARRDRLAKALQLTEESELLPLEDRLIYEKQKREIYAYGFSEQHDPSDAESLAVFADLFRKHRLSGGTLQDLEAIATETGQPLSELMDVGLEAGIFGPKPPNAEESDETDSD